MGCRKGDRGSFTLESEVGPKQGPAMTGRPPPSPLELGLFGPAAQTAPLLETLPPLPLRGLFGALPE